MSRALSGPQLSEQQQLLIEAGGMVKGAVLSDDGMYRYQLIRRWGDGRSHVLWIMLNPSTADASVDDPTIRRCIGFTRAWDFDALTVVNLYAYRETKPENLIDALGAGIDIRGPENKEHIRRSIAGAGLAVLAWGTGFQPLRKRFVPRLNVEGMLREAKVPTVVLGLTKNGTPRHPLYVRKDTEPIPYMMVAA